MSARAEPRLSLVIAAYDMPRQIERTVQSLSPPIQRGVEPGDYELIVVDNGSHRPIDRAACEAFGAQLRWIRIDEAPPSPARALNLGIEAARAPLIGAMIDGARMASPGIVEHALVAAGTYPRPVIATLGFHLGRRLQQQAVGAGYDEEAEAAMLDRLRWEEDGYRLFEASVPGVSSMGGWLAVPAESNALFMAAGMWGELGGFAEEFAAPGGGLVNLDLFARACALPGARLVMLLGEATFHQVHGGVSTSASDGRSDELQGEYERLRGRPYVRPSPEPLFLGSLQPPARAAFERSLAG
ncbi:MAG TPA: glycosyltransferase family A protein [Solirubrobacterales bacterium]|jgi:glycosyltransferase involved in cell wall biosynthesis|nr:glycosyltransferase family A protein [Solirubrobacterales bacterium]